MERALNRAQRWTGEPGSCAADVGVTHSNRAGPPALTGVGSSSPAQEGGVSVATRYGDDQASIVRCCESFPWTLSSRDQWDAPLTIRRDFPFGLWDELQVDSETVSSHVVFSLPLAVSWGWVWQLVKFSLKPHLKTEDYLYHKFSTSLKY